MRKEKSDERLHDTDADTVSELLSNSPARVGDEIDATFHFLYKRYKDKCGFVGIPSLDKLLIEHSDVIFTDKVKHVKIEKKFDDNVLNILAPPVPAEKEEERRIYLLDRFSSSLIKIQVEVISRVKAMLFLMLDAEGKELLLSEYFAAKDSINIQEKGQ